MSYKDREKKLNTYWIWNKLPFDFLKHHNFKNVETDFVTSTYGGTPDAIWYKKDKFMIKN